MPTREELVKGLSEASLDELAQLVVDQMEERKTEDINKWAERLAEDVSKLSD